MKDRGTADDGAQAPQVYLVEDDPSVQRTLSKVLRRAGYRVAAYGSPLRLLEEARLSPPCCLVLDVRLPGMDGVELQEKLAAAPDPPPVVFISGGADVPTSVRAMKAGAVDFLQKPFANRELLAAVAAAMRVAQERTAAAAGAAEALARIARLTPREREVCEAVARGLRSKEIAGELGTAVKTVNVHRSRVMTKLAVTSVAALVKLLDRAAGR